MAISNNSTGLRPGVCTSTTRPTAPYEGQTIYETDTDLTYIWGGSAWQQVSGGTAVGNSGLVYITSVDFAGNTAVNIDGCFTSTYDTYQVVVNGYYAASAGYLYVQTRASGVTDTGTNYVYNENFGAANINEPNWRLAYAYNTTDRTNTIITIYNPLSTATGTMVNSVYSARNGAAAWFTQLTGGQKQTQTADTGLRFTSSAGAVAMNGIVTIYGARKA